VATASPTQAKRRRLIMLGFLRGLAIATVLTILYYVLPFDNLADTHLWIVLTIGIAILTAVTIREVRAVLRASHPAVRAIQALMVIGPLFLFLFAATYFVMYRADAHNFNVSELTRTDALYFTVTTFATVGFGDIVATSEAARVLVTVQMILDLILIGAVVRIFVSAVQMARQGATGEPEQK
jgi:voltage-gated potassium channel